MLSVRLMKLLIEFFSPIRRYLFPQFGYNFTVPQLCFLCQCLENTKNVTGYVVGVGCERGSTTLFLNKFMDARQIDKQYFAVDTFSGFAEEDINYEVLKRRKSRYLYKKMISAKPKRMV